MTKDEFAFIINSELDHLKNEEHNISSKIEVLLKEDRKKELEETNYQLSLIQYKLEAIRKLVNLPIYFRILAMSDEEIEDYKKKQIEILEQEIIDINNKVSEEKRQISEIEKEKEKIISKILDLEGKELQEARERYLELEDQLTMIGPNNLIYGGSITYERELAIESILKAQEEIKKKTSQEIKRELLSKIDNIEELKQEIENIDQYSYEAYQKRIEEVLSQTDENDFDDYFNRLEWSRRSSYETLKMMAEIGKDYKKVREVTKLLNDYSILELEQSSLVSELKFDNDLPKLLQEFLFKNFRLDFTGGKVKVRNPGLVETSVEDFKRNYFDKAKNEFETNFTEDMLGDLVERHFEPGLDVNMDFLEKHKGHFSYQDFDWLKRCVKDRHKKREILRHFKFLYIYKQLDDLDEEIYECQKPVYDDIIKWYKDQLNSKKNVRNYQDVLGVTSSVSFEGSNREQLKEELVKCYNEVLRTENSINILCKKLQNAKDDLNDRIYALEVQKVQIAKDIRGLAFENDKKGETENEEVVVTGVPYRGDLQDFLEAAGRDYVKEFKDKVQEEAESRKITLEELLKINESQESPMNDDTNSDNIDILDDKVFHK